MLAPALIAALLALCAQEPRKPDNLVLIVLDDVGVDLVGAYEVHYRSLGRESGAPANTPAIDNLLAARGVTFTSAWTCPKCSPSRAQILTGRYAHRSGLGQVVPEALNSEFGSSGLSAHATLLPEVLHANDPHFECAAVGKWHLASVGADGGDPRHPLGSPPGRWFDLYAGSLFNLYPAPVERSTVTTYQNWLKTYATGIERDSHPCGEAAPPCEVAMRAPPWSNYATVDTANDAIALAGTLREPWFLYVAFNAVHAPAHDVPVDLPRASCAGYEPPKMPCTERTGAPTAARVRCMLEEADAQIGRLLCALDLDDTTVVLISDNGTSPDAVLPPFEPARGKQTLYEGGVNVPLIVRWRGTAESVRGTVCGELASSTDLFATLAEIAGANVTAGTAQDSISLVPYLLGRPSALRETVYVEEFRPNFVPDPATGAPPADYRARAHGQALRDARFKLIRSTWIDAQDTGEVRVSHELYDLLEGGPLDASATPPRPTRDFFERNDLLQRPLEPESAAAKALAALSAELDQRYPTLVRGTQR